MPSAFITSLRLRLALVLGLFVVIWGAKIAAIDRFGTDLPYWDQWASEGELVFAPYLDRGELWKPLFRPHNEHRIVPTLALNLGLVLAGGQWDARVQCIVNAALHAAIAACLFAWALRNFPRGWALAFGGLLAVLCGAPIAWENLLGGFQSQFYFLIGFGLLTMNGLLNARPWSGRWWLGIAAGALGLISMGSGLLAPAVVVPILGLRLLRGEGDRRALFTSLAPAVLLLAAGWFFRPQAPWHSVFYAKTLLDFLRYLVHSLAWPWPKLPLLALAVWAPLVALAVVRVWRPAELSSRALADFLLAMALWVFLQIAAVAYLRGGGSSDGLPAPRYGDVFTFATLAGLGALGVLRPAWRHTGRAAVVYTALFVGVGLYAGYAAWQKELPERKADSLLFEKSVRAFVVTDDYAALERSKNPFPINDWLARILRMPAVRQILPVSARAPVSVSELGTSLPPAPPLLHIRSLTLNKGEAWQSVTLPPTKGWWRMEVSGYPDVGDSTLQLVSAFDSRPLAMIAPTKPPGDSWRAAYLPAPVMSARIVGRVGENGRWLAFSEPIEMSSLSYATFRFAKYGQWVLWVGLALVLGAGALLTRLPATADPAPRGDDELLFSARSAESASQPEPRRRARSKGDPFDRL